MINLKTQYYLVAVGVFASLGTVAQGSDIWKNLTTQFPGEPAVYVNRSEVLNIVLENDSLIAWSDLSQDMLHLKDQTNDYSDKRIYGSSFSEIADIKAKTLIWDKSRYKEMNVKSFTRNDSRSDGVFYDDSYYYSFDFPAVASQNRTILEYRENIKDVRFVSGYMMQSVVPHAISSFTVRVSRNVDIAFKVLNDPSGKISYQRTTKGDFVTHQWTGKNLPALDYDRFTPPLLYYAPYIEVHVKSYTTAGGKRRVLETLDDLHSWYNEFIKDINKSPIPELKAEVEKIKAESSSELDLVKRVFYWVQNNIQYIAFEQGMRGLIPHPASYVYEKRYGDCKDMANLIVNMLELAGVKAYHTWIGTRDLPYKYSEFPTPIVDNHMIATYVAPDGKYYFLDGTGSFTPLGYPSSMIQGKEALIHFSPQKYEVKTVPEIEAERNSLVDSVRLEIQERRVSGSGVSTQTGYAKVFGSYRLDKSNQDELRSSAEQMVAKGSNKFDLKRFEIDNLHDQDKPLKVRYEFSIGDYYTGAGDEVYINLNLHKDHFNMLIDASRETPCDLEYKYVTEEVFELRIPEGYQVDYLPADTGHEDEIFSFSIRYRQQDGKVVYHKKTKVNYLLMDKSKFNQWNDGDRKLSEAYKETIVLKKKS